MRRRAACSSLMASSFLYALAGFRPASAQRSRFLSRMEDSTQTGTYRRRVLAISYLPTRYYAQLSWPGMPLNDLPDISEEKGQI